jgi:pyrimidine-nucleoside phosphorylase
MRAVDLIRRKRDGGELSDDEIRAFIAGVTDGSWPDYQISALLMAIVWRGLSLDETVVLTNAMVRSGERLDLSEFGGVPVDKHSTGGVGDKLSLVIAPLVAACGGLVPMMSGRGLGHTGGTLDKLESIPGFRTSLTLPEMRAALRRTRCVLIGQTAEIAPADRRLYALRDVTGTVESIPLICGSILSKKIAEGIGALVLDVKVGAGAFMKTADDARRLATWLVEIAERNGVRTEAVLTAMEIPLGRAVGNANEVIESLETLKGNGPRDIEDLSVLFAARMLVLAGVASSETDAMTQVRAALTNGKGLETFAAIIEQQGGDPKVVDDYGRMPKPAAEDVLVAPDDGTVIAMQAELVGRAAVALGAGRDRADAGVDAAAGIDILAPVGTAVRRGDPVFRLACSDAARQPAAKALLAQALKIGEPAAATSLSAASPVIDRITGRGAATPN